MMLGRKISRPKWSPQAGFPEDEVPAATLWSDLKPIDNKISLWEFEGANWQDAALALAAAGDDVDGALDIAWLLRSSLEDDGIELIQTEGRTPVVDLRGRHFDATNLDGFRWATFAKNLAKSIRSDNATRRMSKAQVIAMLKAAVAAGRLDLGELKPKVREAILPTDVGADAT